MSGLVGEGIQAASVALRTPTRNLRLGVTIVARRSKHPEVRDGAAQRDSERPGSLPRAFASVGGQDSERLEPFKLENSSLVTARFQGFSSQDTFGLKV